MNSEQSIYERIRFSGLFDGLSPTPRYSKPVSPYGLFVYKNLLKKSANIEKLKDVHGEKYVESALFRILRPRYSRARDVLRKYNIE